jgi:hypothetical protein
VPDEPGGGDDASFVARLPTYDENVAGREFRAAAERFSRTVAAVNQESGRVSDLRNRPRLDERLDATMYSGWPSVRFGSPKEDPELAAWLDRVCADPALAPDEKPWPLSATEAGTRPLGVYEPPHMVNSAAASAGSLDNARKMAVALLARGLQSQAAGDPAAFVSAFRTAVALARSMRNGGGMLALVTSIELERTALSAADRWFERLTGAPELSRAVGATAAGADDPAPFDPRRYVLADRFVIRGLMQAPTQWLSAALTPPGGRPEWGAAEADLVAFAWSVPWEKERTRRLVGLGPDVGIRSDVYDLVSGRPGSGYLVRTRSPADSADNETYLRVVRRATILKAAVHTFRAERGRLPSELAELVTHGYLAKLPDDPYAEGRSFGYRISVGEELRGPPVRQGPVFRMAVGEENRGPLGSGRVIEEAVSVHPGQAILWSVGVDRIDQGGRVPPGNPRVEDLVFLIPLPPPQPQ